MNKDKQIQRLRKELNRQKQINARLKERLRVHQSGHITSSARTASASVTRHFHEGHVRACLYAKHSFLSYWITSLKISGTYRSLHAFAVRLRRVRLLGVLVKGAYYLVWFLQTSALLLVVSAALFFVILPTVALLASVLALTTLLWGRRNNGLLARRFEGKRLYVFFADPVANLSEHSFFCRNALDFAGDEGAQVLVVIPHYVLSDAFGNKRYYAVMRSESDRLLLVRSYYFFLLRKRVLTPLSDQIRYIY